MDDTMTDTTAIEARWVGFIFEGGVWHRAAIAGSLSECSRLLEAARRQEFQGRVPPWETICTRGTLPRFTPRGNGG